MAKKTLQIKLVLSEILYNIDDVTHLTGRSRQDDNNDAFVANMKTNEEDDVLNQLYRVIGNAYNKLKLKVSEYLSEEESSANNILMNGKNITDTTKTILALSLKVPTNFNFSVRESVATSMHQYIVNTTIADWFKMTNKNDAKDYYDLAESNLKELHEAINKRKRPVRNEVIIDGDDSDCKCEPIPLDKIDTLFEED